MAYDVERKPGGWVDAQARKRARLIWAGFALFAFADVSLMIAGVHYSWGPAPILAFLALVLYLKPHAERYADRQVNWVKGAGSEERVGATLEELRRDGWIVMHDIEVPGAANIDHIASGPNGVFLVETKHRRYEDSDIPRVKGQAASLSRRLGGVWVTPVIALDERRSRWFMTRGVAVVPRRLLVVWLGQQRNQTVAFDRLAQFADTL